MSELTRDQMRTTLNAIERKVRDDADELGGDHSWAQGVAYALRKMHEHGRTLAAQEDS